MSTRTEWVGGAATTRALCVLAPNPSSMTLEGTNTWILSEPGAQRCVVVDPGPLHDGHLDAVLGTVARLGQRVALTLLTHGHWDHAESAARFGELTRAPVHAIGPGHADLRDGDRLRLDGLDVAVVATPGHSRDSVSFLLPAENSLLTGDTVLGWGTTVVTWPDGVLVEYLDSLARLERMTSSGEVTRLLPGHGATVEDAAGKVRFYLEHRHERLAQVRDAMASGTGEDPDAVVALVYADVPRDLWPAARLSVLAQLDYLRGRLH
ncbi:MAG TPA: MBL fold metallo-hydrolase [Dermatophilaceae bacterium]|nr:MBL fold metallo-hydrolase [Dermatophilaceae bacterium]